MGALGDQLTGVFFLDWAALAVSFFNTILLLWLGVTVILNTEERRWGIWLASGGLLMGGTFFISHSVILGQGLHPNNLELNLWWQIGWIPVTALPLSWYAVILWYSGFWQRRDGSILSKNKLHRRHKLLFSLACIASLILVGLLIFSNPLPTLSQLMSYKLATTPSLGGIPILILVYPMYTVLCIGLSMDVLRRPEPSGRLMGDIARQRARRWLSSTALTLLAIGLLVGFVMVLIVRRLQQGSLPIETVEMVGWFDFVIGSLIAVAVMLLGQAVVTYEIFTGKSLPRRGLSQYWRRAVILAAGFSLVLAWSLTRQILPIYSLLLSILLVVVFYALLGWRAYAERERLIQNLRPFVAYKRLYEAILEDEKDSSITHEEDMYEPFGALCEDILETRQACLVPLGRLAPLSGSPLIYPQGSGFPLATVNEMISRLGPPDEIGVALSPDRASGMVFAVSLWSERGLTGVLLLGGRRSGGLYTQEEMEIARAIGEHLIDTKASTEMARRLVSLQRQRLVHSQILDRQTRRVLHDEVLPLVHTSLLNLTTNDNDRGTYIPETILLLEQIHHQLSDLLRISAGTINAVVSRLGLIGALRHIIETDMEGSFDEVTWDIQALGEEKLEEVPALVGEVLFFASREAIRNAAQHARRDDSQSRLCLSISLKYQNGLVITIEDNGTGFTSDTQLEYVDVGSPQPTDESGDPPVLSNKPMYSNDGGSGQGLALHSTMMAVIGGYLIVESTPGEYTRIVLELPEIAWRSWR
jgi:signal transduction histidine kinase